MSELATFPDAVEAQLLEDREEGLERGECCATPAAVATCKRIAREVEPLALSRGVKWVAFGEAGGSVVLVLSSQDSAGRMDFRVAADGQQKPIISFGRPLIPLTGP